MEMYEGKMLFAEFDNQWNAAEDEQTKHSQEYSQDTNDSLTGDTKDTWYYSLHDSRGKMYIFSIIGNKKSNKTDTMQFSSFLYREKISWYPRFIFSKKNITPQIMQSFHIIPDFLDVM